MVSTYRLKQVAVENSKLSKPSNYIKRYLECTNKTLLHTILPKLPFNRFKMVYKTTNVKSAKVTVLFTVP